MAIFYFICIIFFIISLNIAPNYLDGSHLIINLFGVLVMTTIFLLFNNKELKYNFFRHSIFFVFGYLVVHFQKFLDYSLDLTNFDIKYFVSPNAASKSICISSIGLASFFWGYFIYDKIEINKSKNNNKEYKYLPSSKPFVILSFIFLILFISTVNPLYLTGLYGMEGMGIKAGRFFNVLGFLINTVFIIQIWNLKKTGNKISLLKYIFSYGWFFNLTILIFIICVFISGDRGPIITFMLLYFGGYFYLNNSKLKFSYFIILLISSAFIFSLLGSSRSYSLDISYNERIKMAYNDNFWEKSNTTTTLTYELSNSVRCLNYAVDYIDKNGDYKFGNYQLQYILTTIPGYNTLWKYIDEDYQKTGSMKNFSSADYITYLDQGDNPSLGLGTTCVADLYLDFGILGVIIGLGIFGYFIKKCENDLLKNNINLFSLTISLIYLSFAFYISRGVILSQLRISIVIYCIISIYVLIVNILNIKSLKSNP